MPASDLGHTGNMTFYSKYHK